MSHECEPTGCFRSDQRSRRIRSAPQGDPYASVSTTTTTSTTTQTTLPPQFLFDEIVIPDSGSHIGCPSFGTTSPPMYFDAFGGDEKFASGNMIFHQFFNDGIFYISPYSDENFEYAQIEFLMVGGGGGGGPFDGGGGGGGGGVKRSSYNFPKGAYSVNIGKGGQSGADGEETSIKEIGIRSIGGGAGGTPFESNAHDGANGGGAGGRSDSSGGLGLGGYNGGSSSSNYGGGGGGGAGEDGKNAPFNDDDSVLRSAGAGGNGAAITFDYKSYKYYGGGGAGDDFGGLVLNRSLGGGGGTIYKDGIDGLGGGGAGNGGRGGKGFCLIGYIPVTTPAPTTTTTLPPTPPSPVENLSATGEFQKITLRWNDPTDFGSSPISSYTFRILDISNTLLNSITISAESVEEVAVNIGSDLVVTKVYSLLSLENQTTYKIEVIASNSAGDSIPSSASATTVTTTTTTTTLSPDSLSFSMSFDGSIGFGTIEPAAITLNGNAGSRKTANATITATEGYVFYEDPSIDIFGDGASSVLYDEISVNKDTDNSKIFLGIPFIIPDRPLTNALTYINISGVTPTTTTTTTTDQPIIPFCEKLYHTAEFVLNEDNTYSKPSDSEALLNPLQIFVSNSQFPASIAGSISETVNKAGEPWYNGIYFELPRSIDTHEEYVDSLPSNYNLRLLDPQTGAEFRNTNYFLFYPEPQNNSIDTVRSFFVEQDDAGVRYVEMRISFDYICSVTNFNQFGDGDDDIDGFMVIEVLEFNGSQRTLLSSSVINKFNFRYVGSFTTINSNKTYHYMLDFGTREKIVGV